MSGSFFSPDWHMASFGGDPDNFEFPRFDLDICLFRIYEHGKPLKPAIIKMEFRRPGQERTGFRGGPPGSRNGS